MTEENFNTKDDQFNLDVDENSDVKYTTGILAARSNPIEYTNGQKEALKLVESFLLSEDNFFLLAGYSGCGKTTIAENIVKFAKANVLAPTNTAVNRLREKILNSQANFSTIHSCLYSPKDDNGGFRKEKSFESKKTYVIDEVSMIDKYVLEDIIKDAVERECKIIFLGDNFQLEPIGSDPKIFEWEKSYPKSFKKEWKFTLDEVKRYDGSLLKIATELRTLRKTAFHLPENSDLEMRNNGFSQQLGKDIDSGESFTILTATNSERMKFNTMVRRFRYRKDYNPENLPDTLLENEKLISISNGNFYTNGEIFDYPGATLIEEFKLNIYKKGHSGRKAKNKNQTTLSFDLREKKAKPERIIRFYLYKKETAVNNNFDSIFSFQAPNKYDFNQYFLFSPDIKEPSFHGATLLKALKEESDMGLECTGAAIKILFIKLRDTNTMFFNKNVTICTFGYALSTHKSQGNEWNNVYISAPFLMDVWDHARWFYTAITRAKNKVELNANNYIKILK